jgi:glycosyltransferase involved in cell wall biosynthesis
VVEELTERAASLGLLGTQVILGEGWVPYGDRAQHLVDADVGVSLHQHHIETTFAYRTRVLDYLWAGLPVLCSSGDVLSELVAAQGLGQVVEPGDLEGLVTAIRRLRDPTVRAACRERALAVAREQRWDSVARPLIEYCADPWRAPDLASGLQLASSPSTVRRAAAAARRAVSAVRRPTSPQP